MENNRSRIQAWLEAARPKTLPASFSPVLVGCALAYRDGVFKLAPAILCVLVALLAQIASNFANDYFDFKKGADKGDFYHVGAFLSMWLFLVVLCRLGAHRCRNCYCDLCLGLFSRAISFGL